MTGSSLAARTLAALVAVVMLAGIASAAQQGQEVAIRTEDLEQDAGDLTAVEDATGAEVDPDDETSAADEIAEALAAAGQAIAAAAEATVGAIGSAASALGDGLAAIGAAIGAALAAAGTALGEATVWTGRTAWSGAVLVADGLTWLGAGAWTGATALASGLWWLTVRAGDGVAWTALTLGTGLADAAAWLAGSLWEGLLAAGEAWPSDPTHQAIVASSAGGTAAAAGAAWYTRAWRYLKYAPGLAPLYTRISRDELLDHPKREAIYEAIEADPGVHLSELSRKLDLPWGTLLHHLRKLETAELVISDEANGKRCFFLPGQVTGAERDILPALENEKARKIAEYFAENPGSSQSEAADALDYSAALVSWHLNKLEEAGVVERERVGRRQRVGVTQEAQAVVAA